MLNISNDSIDRIMQGEKKIMEHLVELFGFQHWDIKLMSELHTKEEHGKYREFLENALAYIDEAIKICPFEALAMDSRGKKDNIHFAMESAVTHYTVGNGIHLGWYIPGPDIKTKEQLYEIMARQKRSVKRMDEEIFDSVYIALMRVLSLEDQITPIYVKAGFKLGTNDDRAPPYLTYHPENRVLMSDDAEAVRRKIGKFDKLPKIQQKYFKDVLNLSASLGFQFEDTTPEEKLIELMRYLQADGKICKIYQETFTPE